MHSFLVISRDKILSSKKIADILDQEKINLYDRSFFSFEKAAGIEEIKKIAEKLHLKPFKSEKKALILNLSNGITTESQNALLKTLEEPPQNTLIILEAKALEDFLPTIISRCKVIEIKSDQNLSEDFSEHVKNILSATEGEKMLIAEQYGIDRETALEFVEQTVLAASSLAKKGDPKNLLNLLRNLSLAYSDLKYTNVNPRFVLENFLLMI